MTETISRIARYNFWDGKVPGTGVLRATYLDRMSEFIGNKLVKVVVGQRRCGKSYLLRQLINRLLETGTHPHSILYVNKEFTDFDFLSDYSDLDKLLEEFRARFKPEGKVFIFIDEIQEIQYWERFVNSCSQSYVFDYELFITGSNSKLLSGELATLLSGRYIQFEIQTFSYQEFLSGRQLESSRASYLEFIQTGGLPELLHLPNKETKRHYLSALRDTVLLKDIIQRHTIKDARLLEDLFVFLVNNASNLISISNIVNYFAAKKRKTNYETVSNYIGFIEDAFLIHKVDRFNIKGKDTLAGTCKYYINDLSFKNYLYPGFDYGLGYRLENAVYLQLLLSGYTIYTGVLRAGEIDFVAMKATRTIYFQVAYSLTDAATVEREYSLIKTIPDNYEKYVISLDDPGFESNEGIGHVQAWLLEGRV